MNGILFTAHGNFPSGLYSSLKLIAGDVNNIKIVDFLENDGTEGLDKKLNAALNELSIYENIVILTDLAGGTPFNRSVLLTNEKENIKVIAGTNFQMLYTAGFSENSNLDDLVDEIVNAGKEGITVFELPVSKDNNNDFDGI